MAIIGFNLDKIYAEKFKPIQADVQVNRGVQIKDVKEFDFMMGEKTDKVLKFDFEFAVDYKPGVGRIIINGHVLFLEKPAEMKKLTDEWKKKKSIPQKHALTLINSILMRCNIKALLMSQEIGLPPHMRLPTISAKSKVDDYIG